MNQMITRLKTLIYIASDKTEHKTLVDCQRHELIALLGTDGDPAKRGRETPTLETVADLILSSQDLVIEILSESRRKRAKSEKPRKTKKHRVGKANESSSA